MPGRGRKKSVIDATAGPHGAPDDLLTRAVKLGVFGTKMRSVIHLRSKDGIAAVVAQQFDVAGRIAKHGLMPIIEPEVSTWTIPR
jgi:fructose-bisphosphate aldolase class I